LRRTLTRGEKQPRHCLPPSTGLLQESTYRLQDHYFEWPLSVGLQLWVSTYISSSGVLYWYVDVIIYWFWLFVIDLPVTGLRGYWFISY